ncbi:TraK family protein [Sphingomonas sp. PL-96]|uniref:TraK family protein n=1 Tax=Sphingomonas sp. PL-96 TaxID=2887201 RepID=UPI001E53C922|nr:TraK family protein [Sphingomonas sp. PL-96]MCC2978170.1 TraK family protein [Sphingomonas sp. PL-96]
MTDTPPEKSLAERMWEFVNAEEKGSSSRNRIEFLRAKDDIQAALDEGWSGRMIWEQLRAEGRIRFGHTAFAKYVRTLIQGKPALGMPRKSAKKTPPMVAQAAEAAGIEPTPKPKPARFIHNPFPRKEDLI